MNSAYTHLLPSEDDVMKSLKDFAKCIQGSSDNLKPYRERFKDDDTKELRETLLKKFEEDGLSAGRRMRTSYTLATLRDAKSTYASRGELLRRANNARFVEMDQLRKTLILNPAK